MKQELHNPSFFCDKLGRGNVSSSGMAMVYLKINNRAQTFQGSGKMMLSVDAIFGLPRKKTAGESVRPPLRGELFFLDQDLVDECVSSANTIKYSSHKVYQTIFIMNCLYVGLQ